MSTLSSRAGRRCALALSGAALALALWIGGARADFAQEGKLLVFFDAGIAPQTLPRDDPAPVKVGFIGSFEDLEGGDVPALQTMTLRLARGGILNDAGLARCPKSRLVGRTSELALAACRDAQVGQGVVRTAVRFPDGERQRYASKLLLFNTGGGILMHVYATQPVEGTFLVPLRVSGDSGRFGTRLTARFPRLAAGFGYLTGFRMTLQRRFRHRGERRSYLLAACAAPRGLNRVAFELARVEFRFAGGVVVRNSSLNDCRVSR